jgi:protocatechuate 3,4-dioxygenase beta subunit
MRAYSFLAVLYGTGVALACALFGQQASNPSIRSETFTISGTVIDHRSGHPLADVTVTIRAPEQNEPSQSSRPLVYVTSGDGRFAFDKLPPGKYTLGAEARGFDEQGFREYENYSTGIAVGPGLDSEHIAFPLIASGSISGTVVDEEGEPVRQAQISLFHKRVSSGKSRIILRNNLTIDSSGSFHFGHLPPGTYFVAVQAHPWYAESGAGSDLDAAYPITYYAGTEDPAAASPITVTEGSSATIQIALHPVRALHVQLSETEARTSPNIYQEGPGGYPLSVSSSMSVSGSHAEISGVPPGRYSLMLQIMKEGEFHVLGRRRLNVTGDGIVAAEEVARVSLAGQIVFEGNARAPGDVGIVFQKADQYTATNARIAKDGSFTVQENALEPGSYEIQLSNAPGLYLKSIKAKGADFSAGQLEIPDGASVQLSLVAANGLMDVKGIALKDTKSFPGAMVLLVPQDLNRTDLIRRDQSDSDGTFTLYNVAPGNYTLIAIEDGRDLAYAEPSVIKPYLSQGRAVNVRLESASELKVDVVSRR